MKKEKSRQDSKTGQVNYQDPSKSSVSSRQNENVDSDSVRASRRGQAQASQSSLKALKRRELS